MYAHFNLRRNRFWSDEGFHILAIAHKFEPPRIKRVAVMVERIFAAIEHRERNCVPFKILKIQQGNFKSEKSDYIFQNIDLLFQNIDYRQSRQLDFAATLDR